MTDLLKRNFILGDEWIYFKFYSGAQTADKILEEAIKPTTDYLLTKNKIDSWFYIRYADPELHLRVRFHFVNPGYIGIIIRTLYKYIKKFFEHELIWKIQTDTYQREVERYGSFTMILSERIFFLDSSLFINVMPYFKNPKGEIQRWQFALKSIDVLLESFYFQLEDKLYLLEMIKEGYYKKYNMNRFLKSQLDAKFAKERESIEQCLSIKEEANVWGPIAFILNNHKKMLIPVANEIKQICLEQEKNDVSINSLLVSYIHMMMNRIFRSKQQIHELVIYDFLYRYYKSTIARSKALSKLNKVNYEYNQ